MTTKKREPRPTNTKANRKRHYKPVEGRCNKKRPDGSFCMAWPVKGEDHGRCRHHRSPDQGMTNVHYRDGKRSKKESLYLREKAAAMMEDPNLLTLEREVALSRVREDQLIDSLDEIPAPETLARFRQLAKAFREAMAAENDLAVAETWAALEAAICFEDQRPAVWNRILRHQEHRRKLVDTERKYREKTAGMVPIETMHAIIDTLLRLMIELRHLGELTPAGMKMLYETYVLASRRWQEPMKAIEGEVAAEALDAATTTS